MASSTTFVYPQGDIFMIFLAFLCGIALIYAYHKWLSK